jgi:cyanosortase A-associated protein
VADHPADHQIEHQDRPKKPYPWQSWLFLALASVCTLSVVRMLLDPRMGKPLAFNFPDQIPVAGWRVSKIEALQHPDQFRPEIVDSRRYLYTPEPNTPNQGRASIRPESITVDSRYYATRKVPVTTNELLNPFMFNQTYGAKPLPFTITSQEFSPDNYYDLFHHQQKAYLSACIEPTGFSAVNLAQMRQRQLAQRRNPLKLVTWLFSPAPLMDERCVWTQLSIPFTGSDPQPSYKVLGQFWAGWFPWWQQNYPKLLPY